MNGHAPVQDIVALGTRLRHLQLLRVIIAVAVATWALMTEPATGYEAPLVPAVGYLATVGVAELYLRHAQHRGLAVFNVMVLVDGLVLVWASLATGGTVSPLSPLVLTHVAAVALLASYRTGTKVALWDSLLLLAAHHAMVAGALPGGDTATGLPRLVAFLVALWVIGLATATFSAVNERELRRQRFDLDALARTADALERLGDPREVAEVLLSHIVDTFGFRRGVALTWNDGQVRSLGRWPVEIGAAELGTRPLTSPLLLQLQHERRTLLLARLVPTEEADLTRLLPAARHLVCVPLRVDGDVVGAVLLEHDAVRIPWRTLTMVERFCGHGALALENAWLLQQLRTIAATDGLTGLSNRREFDLRLRRDLARAERSGSPVSLALLDIDHFKPLNDTHGHQVGDDVLREVAHLLQIGCRDFDVVARYGGEEFAVVLPDTDSATAADVAERLRHAIARGPLSVPVTVSIGVATTTTSQTLAADDLITAADTALYQAKRDGRDQVTVAQQPRPATPTFATATQGAA